MINGINVQNNPLKYIDPRGLEQQIKTGNQSNSDPTNVEPKSFWERVGQAARGVADNVKKAAGAVASVANQTVVKATAFHFEKRAAINEPFKNYTYKDVKTHKDWTQLDDWQVGSHSNKVGKMELKYVHTNTGAELVFDGDSPDKQLTQIGLAGTANYVNPAPLRDIKGVRSALKFVAKNVGHGFADLAPYIFLGGDVRGPDPD